MIAGIAFEAPVLSLRGGAIARARAEQRLAEHHRRDRGRCTGEGLTPGTRVQVRLERADVAARTVGFVLDGAGTAA